MPLFTTSLSSGELIETLDRERVSSELQQCFAEHGHTLTKKAQIRLVESQKRWKILDKHGAFLMERKGEELVVYQGKRPPYLWITENIEAIVVAVLFALLIRHYVMEAFVIPTGSMAPTLVGIHANITCPNCGYSFRYGHRGGSYFLEGLVCPNCKFGSNQTSFLYEIKPRSLRGGDKILVNKFFYFLTPPRRWDVIVFRSPNPDHKNFIKRLIGLPGETIQLFHGDVYRQDPKTKKFVLLRKPDHIQKVLWMHEYDSRYVEKNKKRLIWHMPGAREKKYCHECGELYPWDSRVKIGENLIEGDFRKKRGILRYHRSIRNLYGYNSGGAIGNLVGDVRLRWQAKWGKEAKVTVEMARFFQKLKVVFDFSQKKMSLERTPQKGPREILLEKPLEFTPEDWHTYDLSQVDGQVYLRIDGQELFRATFSLPASMESEDPEHYWLQFMFEKTAVKMRNIQIFRDIYYTDSPSRFGVVSPIRLGPRELFAMGDNSPNSLDSRQWGPVPLENLMGRAFVIFWPPLRWIR